MSGVGVDSRVAKDCGQGCDLFGTHIGLLMNGGNERKVYNVRVWGGLQETVYDEVVEPEAVVKNSISVL